LVQLLVVEEVEVAPLEERLSVGVAVVENVNVLTYFIL
jgi:hypothetical protein